MTVNARQLKLFFTQFDLGLVFLGSEAPHGIKRRHHRVDPGRPPNDSGKGPSDIALKALKRRGLPPRAAERDFGKWFAFARGELFLLKVSV